MNIPAEIENIALELSMISAGTHIVVDAENLLELLDDISAMIREYNREGKPNPHSVTSLLRKENEYAKDIYSPLRTIRTILSE